MVEETEKRKMETTEETHWLNGRCLISMPDMSDPRFERTVILICSHDEDGAMGLVINRRHDSFTFEDLCQKLSLKIGEVPDIDILAGGPVEVGRGFVLQVVPPDDGGQSMLRIGPDVALSATLETLEAIAVGSSANRARVALGYAGWAPGQLENELKENVWLVCDADAGLVFADDPTEIYGQALARLGIDLGSLVSGAGHA